MKQAKLALTAVAVLAVVGGALAFKAQRGNIAQYYTNTVIDGASHCTVLAEKDGFSTAKVGANPATLTVLASTTTSPNPCSVITLYSFN